MTAIFCIAFAYFSALALQRWTNGIGLALLISAVALRVMTDGKTTFEIGATLAMLGGLLLLLPMVIGGGMMRTASTRVLLHQRPRGRQQMFLGATLAVTMIATALTLILTLVLEPDGIPGIKPPPWARTPPLAVFAVAWSIVAMTWLVVFIATGNRLLSMLIGFVPLAMIKLGRPLVEAMPDRWLTVTLCAATWAGFALWYLRAPSIRRTISSQSRMKEFMDNPVGRFIRWIAGSGNTASRTRAMDLYLLGTSLRGHAVLGVMMALAAAVVQLVVGFFVHSEKSDLAKLQFMSPFFFAPVIIITCGVLGFALTRRARILWLRAGLDRMALFRQVESSGLLGITLICGVFLVAIVLYSLAKWPERSEILFVFLAVQIAFLLCLFYGCLSLTRGWSAVVVLLGVALLLVLVAEVLLLQPWTAQQSPAAPFVLGAVLVLVPVFRWHARRRWATLDWRVARLPQMLLRG
jgi:hypothetical protein